MIAESNKIIYQKTMIDKKAIYVQETWIIVF
jgi:hypothetical protein